MLLTTGVASITLKRLMARSGRRLDPVVERDGTFALGEVNSLAETSTFRCGSTYVTVLLAHLRTDYIVAPPLGTPAVPGSSSCCRT